MRTHEERMWRLQSERCGDVATELERNGVQERGDRRGAEREEETVEEQVVDYR